MNAKVDGLVEITLKSNEDFLKVKETLTRIGVASKKEKVVFQSCHIRHKQGKYYLVHFKELFKLDGRPADFDDKDLARRNTIANLLQEWGLIKIYEPSITAEPVAPLSQIKVLSYKEKADWQLVPKYNIGRNVRN